MPSPIIARADALMHRKRQSSSEFDDVPVLTDSIDDDNDIPLLTDIAVAPEPELAAALEQVETNIEEHVSEPCEAPSPAIHPALREQLVQELAARIEERLKAALPQIINSTVMDFLAEHEMIANS
ncbi:MAG: hypothetical protein IPJ12_17490 [Betaproteobacteria bacterium]|nr:hypothetical protein [Betaproteobacteria bacterium]